MLKVLLFCDQLFDVGEKTDGRMDLGKAITNLVVNFKKRANRLKPVQFNFRCGIPVVLE
jgi:hypothetical protein